MGPAPPQELYLLQSKPMWHVYQNKTSRRESGGHLSSISLMLAGVSIGDVGHAQVHIPHVDNVVVLSEVK